MTKDEKDYENLIREYDQAAKMLIRKDIELSRVNRKSENLIREYDQAAKMLFRKDIELSRANETLQELDKIKSNFISIVAHQLRTPLSGIKWTINILLTGEMGELNNDQRTFLMKTYESNNRMITLVNDMLDVDRIQSGKIHYKFQCINIVDLVDNILFEVAPQVVKKSISIEFKNKLENLPKALVDPETIRAVIQNLLDNAINYTIDGGRIVLDILVIPNYLQISISDDGIGIPEEEQKNIFNRFFRGSNAIKHLTDGSGLGLYIAKEIIQKNGGKIWFESRVGKGTTFYFTVPIESENPSQK